VGSIRNGLVNYTQDMKYFEGTDSHKIRHTVDEDATHIKDTIDRDILVTKAPQWNTSVGIVGHDNEKSERNKLFDIKTGLADEKATHKTKDQPTYAGTETRDAYHTGWEVSN